jgi:phosphoglycerol transferase MdoB-like AlkP superfamily enzyme
MDSNIVNQQYKGNYITPFLHSLASSSIYYPYTMSYHEGGGTSDSEFSVLNSVEPLQYYPSLKLSNYSFPNSLISRMDAGQFSTFAFHGNVGSFYNRDVAFPKLGFQEFYDMLGMKLPESGWGLPDSKVFDYTLSRIKTAKQPFLSYTITMSSHEPFNSVRNYYNNSLYGDIKDTTVQNYFNSFSYVDQSIKNFVQEVQKNFKNTYIIIYGDHTPNINSAAYKQASYTMDNRYFEFVPMFIITPDSQVRKESAEAASLIDVAPTILETSGINFDLKSNGQNLTDPALNNDNLPFKGGSYSRSLLFQKASASAVN